VVLSRFSALSYNPENFCIWGLTVLFIQNVTCLKRSAGDAKKEINSQAESWLVAVAYLGF